MTDDIRETLRGTGWLTDTPVNSINLVIIEQGEHHEQDLPEMRLHDGCGCRRLGLYEPDVRPHGED